MALFLCVQTTRSTAAMSTDTTTRSTARLTAAVRLVLARYYAQARRMPLMTIACIVLPAAADILTYYAPPLVIARLLGRFGRNESLTANDLMPYVLAFAGLWITGQVCWRVAVILITRVEIRGLEALYIEAMAELLARDLGFFKSNSAGSLPRRALGSARRFEDVFDVIVFQIAP